MRTHLARGEYTPGKRPTDNQQSVAHPARHTAQQKATPRHTPTRKLQNEPIRLESPDALIRSVEKCYNSAAHSRAKRTHNSLFGHPCLLRSPEEISRERPGGRVHHRVDFPRP